MKINLNEMELLNVLELIRKEYMDSKAYYEENQAEEDRIGITSPAAWRELYNNLITESDTKLLDKINK